MSRVAVVTGANKGIGLGIVKGLCKQFDGTVYLTARDENRGQEAVKELNKQGCQPRFHQLDVSSLDSIHRFKQHLEQEHQGLDVLVNNAGVMYGAAENLRKILEAHNSKRRRIADLCHDIAVYFPRLDKSIKDNLKTLFGREAEDILRDVQIQLHKEECPILVAGETSSGKSTFLNLLLGDNILPVADLSSTSTICEVKYGETKQAVVHLREPSKGKQGQRQVKTIALDSTKERRQELESYIHVKGASRDSLPPAERVEIFWPLPLLQGGIVLVDSPGVGESEMMDKVVAEYIPKCFAFLYIIDSSRAGGVQQDRLGRLLQLYAKKDSKDSSEDFNPESAMFVCNKWDLVKDREEVKSETFRKLSEMWPGLEKSQVFFVSTEQAVGPFGILSEDFTKVLDGLDLLLPKSLDIKLDTQYRLLTRILSAALMHINSVLNVARQNLDRDTKVKMWHEAQKHVRSFQDQTNMKMEELNSLMSSNMKSTEDALSSLVESGELKEDILNADSVFSWTRPFYTKLWYNGILVTLKNEKKEWNDDEQTDNFPKLKQLCEAVAADMPHCPSFKDNITSMQNCFEQATKEAVESVENAHQETMFACGCGQMDIRKIMTNRRLMKWLVELCNLLISVSTGYGTTYMSVYIAQKIASHVRTFFGSSSPAESILRFYWDKAPEGTPLVDILMQALSSSDKLLMTEIAERQMKPQRDLSVELGMDIITMTNIMKQTIDDTFKDTRSNEEIVKTYQPQSRAINSFQGQLAMFHLAEMRKYEYDLDSITGRKDTRNKIGGGSFGEVYQVQVPYKGAETPAALKLGIMPYDIITTETACDFLKEEDNLRKLRGDHIVEYYGTACTRVEGGLKLGLVMELCEGTLESRIIGNRDRNPVWWVADPEKLSAAVSYTQNLAVQLCEGLKTIHDAGYIHRDLKLINILVSKDNTVKLADVGLTKREDKITGTIAGTPLYAAPEVKERKVYNKSADIYSLGLILWEMWYGITLYRLKRSNPTPLVEQVEVTMGINFFGTLNLTKVLTPLLRPHARIVNVSSMMGGLSYVTPPLRQTLQSEQLTEEDLVQLMKQFISDVKSGVHEEKGWKMDTLAYRVSKMGVTALSRVLQRQFDANPGTDIVVNALCPGWVRTDMGGPNAGRSVEKGAETPIYLALLPPNVSSPRGELLQDKEVVSF